MIQSAQSTSSTRERFRIGLVLGGILIAIIVSVFLVKDAGADAGAAMLLPNTATLKQMVHQSAHLGVENLTAVITSVFSF